MERKHLILLIIWAWLLPCAHGQNVLPYKTQTIDGVEYYIYPVKRSEGLYRISVNFGVTQEEIIRLNPEVKDGLRAGQLLFIPKKTPQAQPTQQSTSGQTHTPPPVDLIAASLAGSHATPPPAAPQPTASTPQPDNEPNFYYHKVLPKQTLYSLSKQYGVRQDDIIRYNPQAATGLRAGEVLRIPKPEDIYQDRKAAKQQEDLSVKYLIHRVQPKETLYAISKQYAVEMNDILRLNPGLEVLTIGQELLTDSRFVDCASLQISRGSDGGHYLVMDGLVGSSGSYMASCLFRCDEAGRQLEPVPEPGGVDLYNASLRYYGSLYSMDIDNDGMVEIPTQVQDDSLGITSLVQEHRLSFVAWNSYTSQRSRQVSFGVLDEEYGYYLPVPFSLRGQVSLCDSGADGWEIRDLTGDTLYLRVRVASLTTSLVGYTRIATVGSQQVGARLGPDSRVFSLDSLVRHTLVL